MSGAVSVKNIIGSPVSAIPFDTQIQLIIKWATLRLSKYVCVANVHMLMEAHWQDKLASVLNDADLVTPDGMPLVWMLKLMGEASQDRVAGMELMLALCKKASAQNVSVFFVGSQQAILDQMKARFDREFPNLKIAGMEPLPFRPLTKEEDEALIKKINESGAGLVLVSLGCPKQEYWMAEHKGRIQGVMIGLGGVFPVYAGIQKWAPRWVRESGFEWLYRLVQEPGRLWNRYSKTIPPFLWLAAKQLLKEYSVNLKARISYKLNEFNESLDDLAM